ncbi:MAG: PAS domain S-box protein [Balneola sp.]
MLENKLNQEEQRLKSLQAYDIHNLSSHEENALSNLTQLAAQICDVPYALINFIDKDTQWTKASFGMDLKQMLREDSFCTHTIKKDRSMVVEDATKDERFKSNKLVTEDPNVRFYAGANIKSKSKHNIGSICVLGTEHKKLSQFQKDALETLSREVAARLELKKKNEELKQRAIFLENSTDLMFIVDCETFEVEYVNKEIKRIFGYSDEEALGQSFFDLLSPEESFRKSFNAWKQNIAATNFEEEGVFKTREGQEIDLSINISENEEKWYATARDISKRKSVERKLNKEKIFQKNVLETVNTGIIACDKNKNLTLFNDKAREFYGISESNVLLNKDATYYIVEKSGEKKKISENKHPISRALSGEEITNQEIDIVLKGHPVRHILINGKPIKDQYNEIQGAVVALHDITELKREKQITEDIINSLPINFFMYNASGEAVRWNDNVLETTGYTREEVNELKPTDYFLNEDKARIENYFKRVIDGKREVIEANLVDKTGKKTPYLFNATVMLSGEESFLLGTGQDISAQKNNEKKLQELLAHSETLLSEIHHRVKNNLAVVSGLLQLQCYEIENKQAQEALFTSQMRIKSMAMVHESLYESANFSNINYRDYLTKLLRSVEDALKKPDKIITLETDIDDVDLNINQAIPLSLIINELVSNCYKHAFEGRDKGKIKVSLLGRDRITLKVVDNGIGIPSKIELENQTSLGFTLVTNLLEQLESSLEINKVNKTGLSMEFSFKKAEVSGSGSTYNLKS